MIMIKVVAVRVEHIFLSTCRATQRTTEASEYLSLVIALINIHHCVAHTKIYWSIYIKRLTIARLSGSLM